MTVLKHKDFNKEFLLHKNTEPSTRLVNNFFDELSNIDESLIEYYKKLTFIESVSFVLECENEMIGYARLVENHNYFLLSEIFIMKDFRELGLGTFILSSIRNYLQDLKIPLRTVTLPSDRQAKNFYEANGITARILLMEEKREKNRIRP
jgi:GNAT superfamily N-acetyltransferase